MSYADIPRHLAQAALIQQMLLDHGKERVSEPFLHYGRLYRITVERVAIEDVPDETRRFLKENGHGHD